MQETKVNKLGIFLIFALMFLASFIENTRGIFIPIFKDDFAVSNTAISSMITGVSLAGMVVTFIGGTLIEKLGQKKTLLLGIVCLILGIIIQAVSGSYLMFFVGFVPIIAGLNIFNVTANTMVPIIFVGSSTIAMNLLHFMYGAGSTISQNAIGILLDKGITWRIIYFFIAALYLLVLVSFKFTRYPDVQRVPEKEEGGSVLRNPMLYVFGAALGFYVFAEQGMSLWLPNYLKEAFGLRESIGARYLGAFFLLFAIGRLLGGFIVQKTGVLKAVIITEIVALVLLFIGVFFGTSYLFVISISGLFYSIVFPSTMSLVSKIFRERPGMATGFIMTMVAFILNSMNLIMGILMDQMGPRFAIMLLPVSMGISLGLMIFIRIRTGGHEKAQHS
jgi:fucose permease